MQRDFDSSLLFNALYLSISDILLTHTHTHTHTHIAPGVVNFLNLSYAREDSRVNSNKQRAQQSSLCSVFMPFREVCKR